MTMVVKVLLDGQVLFRYMNNDRKKKFKPRAGYGLYDKYY